MEKRPDLSLALHGYDDENDTIRTKYSYLLQSPSRLHAVKPTHCQAYVLHGAGRQILRNSGMGERQLQMLSHLLRRVLPLAFETCMVGHTLIPSRQTSHVHLRGRASSRSLAVAVSDGLNPGHRNFSYAVDHKTIVSPSTTRSTAFLISSGKYTEPILWLPNVALKDFRSVDSGCSISWSSEAEACPSQVSSYSRTSNSLAVGVPSEKRTWRPFVFRDPMSAKLSTSRILSSMSRDGFV